VVCFSSSWWKNARGQSSLTQKIHDRTVTQDTYDTWILQSLAFRTAFLLGLNRPPPPSNTKSPSTSTPPDFISTETRRRVWWFLYICDRYTVSMGTDLRQQFDDEQCHLAMPCKESLWRGLPGPEFYVSSVNTPNTSGPNSGPNSGPTTSNGLSPSPTLAATSTTPVPTNPAYAEFSQYTFHISIVRLLAQIGDFNWREKKDRAWYDSEHAALDKALQSWFVALPSCIQTLGSTFSTEWSNDPSSAPHWSFLLIHVLYNTAYLQLNYSRMMASVERASNAKSSAGLRDEQDEGKRDTPNGDSPTDTAGQTLKTCKAFQTCLIAARTLVQLTSLGAKSNPLFLYLCRYTIYCRYQSALVLSVVLHHASQNDPGLYSTAMADLDVLFRVFEAESRHCAITRVFLDKLRGLKSGTALDFYV
jgi:hypothetical protein